MIFLLIARAFYPIDINFICFISFLTLCSDWTKHHREFGTLKETFQENGYLEPFVDKCFKKILNSLHIVKRTLTTTEKKCLSLVLPYFWSISLKVGNKIKYCNKKFFKLL